MDEEKFILSGPPEPYIPDGVIYSEYILQHLQKGGNAIAQICNATGQTTTYEEIRRKSIQLAIALQNIGVKKGDTVAISSENRFEFTVTAVAVMLIGAVNATLNILYTRNELIHTMNISKPVLVFCSPLSINNIMNVTKEVPSIKKIVLFGDKKPNPSVLLYKDFFSKTVDVSRFKVVKVDLKTDPIAILCSSGTTGLPKGVVLTHYNFLVCNCHLRETIESAKNSSGCLLSLAPWFHAYGFITHLCSLALNFKMVFLMKFEEEAFLSAIQNYKVTMLMLVPPLMIFLAKHPSVDKYDLSSLEEILCGAAHLSKDIEIAVQNRIGVKNIKQGYGLTETTLAVLSNRSTDTKFGSCGKVAAGTKAKVIDLETNKTLGPYKEGELCFKGPMLMKGYLGDRASTEAIVDKDGWIHTGDVGYYDDEEYFFIVDRIKELIKYKGYQVPPAELEALILQHPKVKDVGVVGLPDEAAGELPLAFVVLQPGLTMDEEELVKFVSKQVSQPKRLHGGVRFVDEIPKNPSGKILRRKLRDLLKQQAKSKL